MLRGLTSSGVATNPTGRFFALFAKFSFCCSLDWPILSQSSVITIPGTTPIPKSASGVDRCHSHYAQLTRIFFSVSSLARPCVMVKRPALRDPPIDAVTPGFMAPVPDVRVSEPPGLIISYLETTSSTTISIRQQSIPSTYHTTGL